MKTFAFEAETMPREEAYQCFTAPQKPWKGRIASDAGLALKRGMNFMERGRFKSAVSAFAAAARNDPRCALAHAWRGEARLNLTYYGGEVPEDMWRRQRRLYPYRRLFYIGRLVRNLEIGDLKRDFERAIALDRSVPWFHIGRGEVDYILLDYRKASQSYAKSVELDPGCGLGILHLAEVYFRSGRFAQAAEFSRRAIDLRPQIAWLHAYHARMLDSPTGLSESLQSMLRACRLDPNTGWFHSWLGEIYRKLGRMEEALASFDRAIELNPDDALAHAWRGAALRRCGRSAEAIESLKRATALDRDYAYAFSELSQALIDFGRPALALEPATRAQLLDTKYVWAFRDSRQPQSYDRAMNALTRLSSGRRSPVLAHAWLGKMRLEEGRVAESLASLDRAARTNPRAALTRVWRGQSRLLIGNVSGAARDFRAAVRRDPLNGFAWGWLGRAMRHLNRPREALRCLKRAILLDPHNCRPWGYLWRGLVQVQLGNLPGGLDDMENHLWVGGPDAPVEALRDKLRRALAVDH